MIWVLAILSAALNSDTSDFLRHLDPTRAEILIKLRPGVSTDQVRHLIQDARYSFKRNNESSGLLTVYPRSAQEMRKILLAFNKLPEVQYAELNSTRRAFTVPQDPDFTRQWNLHNFGQNLTGTFPPMAGTIDADIDAPNAWNINRDAPNVIVALIDSGVDYNHPDLGDEDLNNTGFLDTDEDTNGNRILDPGEDLNGNLVLDTDEDANGNRILDSGEDLNGNLVLDTDEDTNGNRILDPGEDLNGNGILETFEDGNANRTLDRGNIWVNLAEDFNLNGIADPSEDTNHNGILDPGEDFNGNGIFDFGDLDQTDSDGNLYEDDVQGWNFSNTTHACALISGSCNCVPKTPVNGNNDPMDDYGHGTASAGIVAAKGNNTLGVAGVAWTANIMPVKFLDKHGCGTVDNEVDSILYAIQNGAKIIVINAGGSLFVKSEFDAIRAAGEAGILVIAPAGNDRSNNDNLPVYPAGYDLPNLISVAASDPADQLAYFSNYGPVSVDLAAPGDCVYTTMPTGDFELNQFTNFPCHYTSQYTKNYDYVSGTSFAAAHVAGVAALLLSQDPSLTPAELKAILVATSDPLGSLRGKVASGGRLNATRALTRDVGASFTGGTGGDIGCGFILPYDGDHRPPPSAWATLLVMFLPLIFSLRFIRKRLFARPTASPIALLTSMTLGAVMAFSLTISAAQAQTDANEDTGEIVPLEYPHSLQVKMGLHLYPKSDYFSANKAFFDQRDLISPVGELEYDYIFHPHSRFGLAVGRYSAKSSFKGICCSTIEFTTRYLLMTVKFDHVFKMGDTRTLRLYAGPGIGFYEFRRKTISLGNSSRFQEKIHGFHLTAGLETSVTPRLTVFLEARMTNAVVASANAYDDALNIGGHTALLGLSWTFPFSRPALPST